MDPDLPGNQDKDLRYSDSPRRWTQVTPSLSSPVKSVRPEYSVALMDSLDSQIDFGHRTTDFFEEESSDEEPLTARRSVTGLPGPDLDARERSISPGKRRSQRPPLMQAFVSQCEPKGIPSAQAESEQWPLPQEPSSEGYQRLDSKMPMPIRSVSMASTSYNGSIEEVDELPADGTPHPLRTARVASGRTARSSGNWKDSEPVYDPRRSTFSSYSDKAEQRLGVHAIAYDLFLNGLLRDDEVMRQNKTQLGSSKTGPRSSMTPQRLNDDSPRSPREAFSAQKKIDRLSKKVHAVPPPIQVSHSHPSLPHDIVLTPYPFDTPRSNRKEFDIGGVSRTQTPSGSVESILTLSIGRSNSHSKSRVTSLTIPASNDFTVARNSREGANSEKPFTSTAFDDAELFSQVRLSYTALAGPFRLFSARSLSSIHVSGPATRAADAGYGWLHQPRSPRILAYKGLMDTFSEEKILQHYRKPALGKSRYAFVHWAHRLAAAPPVRTPTSGMFAPTTDRELVRQAEQPEGLEFLVSWSVKRIMLAFLLVLLLSAAAALLWIFLGKNTSPQFPAPQRAGYRGAGDRVGTGVLLGICVLLFGLSSIGGWLGMSWLLM